MLTDKKITELDLLFVKEYLKVDFTDDDTLISTLLVAAKSYIETLLGYKLTSFENFEDIPDELTIACLMLVAHWYDQRQIQTTGTLGVEMAFAISAIVDAHRDHIKGLV
jgi:uncharacterized phage protein (predicted DNA packaging)